MTCGGLHYVCDGTRQRVVVLLDEKSVNDRESEEKKREMAYR